MQFQRAKLEHLGQIMEIIGEAQAFFRQNGIDQWQDGYPNREVIVGDIAAGNSYVVLQAGEVAATAALVFGGDPNYAEIYEGRWLSSLDYGALHRIAVRSKYKGQGVAALIIEEMVTLCLERGVGSMRGDTHRDNLPMQRMLQKNGFTPCGVIFLADGSPRVAFERILE